MNTVSPLIPEARDLMLKHKKIDFALCGFYNANAQRRGLTVLMLPSNL